RGGVSGRRWPAQFRPIAEERAVDQGRRDPARCRRLSGDLFRVGSPGGRGGIGLNAHQLDPIRKELESGKRPDPPCTGPVPKDAETTWIEPAVVCEVRYKEVTDQGL